MKRLAGLAVVAAVMVVVVAPWQHAPSDGSGRPAAPGVSDAADVMDAADAAGAMDAADAAGAMDAMDAMDAGDLFDPARAAWPVAVARAAALADPPDPPATVEELRERVAAILAEHRIPGVGIALVTTDGVVWSGGVGVADRASGRRVTADTAFRAGSISKTVVALAVLRLVEARILSLDDRLRDLAPEIAPDSAWADTDPITVAHLLEHTAGFDDMRFNEWVVPDGRDDLPLAEVLALNPRSRAPRWRPGSRHAYANPGYTVAAYLIEKVTGVRFEDYVAGSVLRPLGMTGASFTLTPELADRLARGYRGRTSSRAVPHRRLHHRPAGELMASPRELGGLVRMLLRRGVADGAPHGRLLRPDSIARMERSETTALPVLDTAYGLGNHGDVTLPAPTRGHNGGLPGFISELRYSTDLGVGYVLLFNSSSPALLTPYWRIRQLVFAYLTRDRPVPEPPAVDVPADQLAGYAGDYELTSPRFQLTGFLERLNLASQVSLRGDTLILHVGDLPAIPLIPVGTDRFRFPWTSGPIIRFGALPGGDRVMVWSDMRFERGSAWGRISGRVLAIAVWLMDLAVFWNIVWLPGWLWVMFRIRKRMPMPAGSVAALTSLGFFSMVRLFTYGAETMALGAVNGVSVAVFVLSVLFPVLAVLAAAQWLRWLQPGRRFEGEFYDLLVDGAGFLTQIYRRGWYASTYSVATSISCLVVAAYFTWHGFVAVRTWAW